MNCNCVHIVSPLSLRYVRTRCRLLYSCGTIFTGPADQFYLPLLLVYICIGITCANRASSVQKQPLRIFFVLFSPIIYGHYHVVAIIINRIQYTTRSSFIPIRTHGKHLRNYTCIRHSMSVCEPFQLPYIFCSVLVFFFFLPVFALPFCSLLNADATQSVSAFNHFFFDYFYSLYVYCTVHFWLRLY